MTYLDEAKRRQAAYFSLGLVRAMVVAGALPKDYKDAADVVIKLADCDDSK